MLTHHSNPFRYSLRSSQEEKKDPPLEDATVVQEREDDRPQAFISVLVALMEHRLDEKLYSSASAVGQLMAELALPAP